MRNKKILVTGAYGLLGTILCKQLEVDGYNVYRHGRKKSRDEFFNLKSYVNLKNNLDRIKPNIIINLLALTNVELCEKNFSKALDLNAIYLKNFSKYLNSTQKKLNFIHISTDQVYSGEGPHFENEVNPINNYALTKYFGEIIINPNKTLILRTNFVGKSENKDRKSLTDWFISNMKKNKKITLYKNIYFNPLEINYLSSIIIKIMHRNISGTFNLGARGGLSKAEFLLRLGKKLKLNLKKCKVSKITFSKKTTVRPTNMIMNCKKFEKVFKIKLPSLQNQIIKTSKTYI